MRLLRRDSVQQRSAAGVPAEGRAVEGLEITVVLGVAVLAAAVLAPRLRIAAPLLLLIFGVVLGFIPQLRAVELPSEMVLLLFLPVMLFWESLTTSLRSIRRDFRGIVLNSTLLVVATAFAVAWVAHLLGLPWQAAMVLGAAVAPPDATAVAALGRTLPHRNFMLLKAESLTNDGTALVLYAIALGVAVGGQVTPLTITGMVALSYFGGAAAGALVGGVAYLVMRRLGDAMSINIAFLLIPFLAFLLAELIGASGVLAVVVAGLIVAYQGPRMSTAASRRQTEWTWPLGSYLLNGSLFVLIGIQMQDVAREMNVSDIGWLLWITLAVWLLMLVVRFGFQVLSVAVIRLLDRRPEQRARRMSHRARVVSAIAGFRGAVSLAIALSVPTALPGGAEFPGRGEIVFVTAGVIALTLLVQGPVLPFVVSWARLPEDSSEEELRLAERTITQAAIKAVPELADEHGVGEEVRNRLLRDYEEHWVLIEARDLESPVPRDSEEAAELNALIESGSEETAEEGDEEQVGVNSPLRRNEEYTRLRVALLERKREVLVRLRTDGVVDDSIVRRVQSRLDVEELRLTGTHTY